ncbi:unnamed protein product [Knipowitschia caucasica]|uniref:Protein FAM198B n=1 Tax=Knipowitschia caucasica TaxID=637954 RepID=A0AAV2MIJ2_KNICA
MGKCGCFPLLKLVKTFRRSRLLKKAVIVASVCALYLVLVAGFSSRNAAGAAGAQEEHPGHTRGPALRKKDPEALPAAAPTRSNVVYITLKAKRLQAAGVGATVRPQLRRRQHAKTQTEPFTRDFLEREVNRTFADAVLPASQSHDVEVERVGTRDSVSSIRIYSQKPPPWLTPADVYAMRFLADAKVLRVGEVARGSLLVFSDGGAAPGRTQRGDAVCQGRCGLLLSSADSAEVLAFHLDRVLLLNRTLPTVCRTVAFARDSCVVQLWDTSPLSPVRLTWSQYQLSLKHSCWLQGHAPVLCSSVHHHEWSRLALFDFLLQIHRRLDPGCCGFRPQPQDECSPSGCVGERDLLLGHLHHRTEAPRQLIFTHNHGDFTRQLHNLDFRLLEGITQLPAAAVAVLRSGRLRERLLQSLFMDQTFWESRGGRAGIDSLIEVLERRAKALLSYMHTHGLTPTPM